MKAYMGDSMDEQGVDLLLQMLRYNPDERISVCPVSFREKWLLPGVPSSAIRKSVELVQAKQALKHPWFDDIDRAAMDKLENPAVLQDALASESLDAQSDG
jgi:hypothetical protein